MKFLISSYRSTAISGIFFAKMSVPRMVCSRYKIDLVRSHEIRSREISHAASFFL